MTAGLRRDAGRLAGWRDGLAGSSVEMTQCVAEPDRLAVEGGLEPSPAFQLQLEDRMREAGASGTVAKTACSLIAGRFGVARVLVAAFDGLGVQAGHGRVQGAWPDTAGEVGSELLLEEFGTEATAALASGRSVWVTDVRLDSRLRGGAVQAAWAYRGLSAFAAAPILQEGRLAAVLVVADDRVHAWQDGDHALLPRVAGRVWRAICEARADADLRRSLHEHRMAIELCPQIFWTATSDGSLDKTGPIFGQLATRRTDQLDMGWRRTTHPDDLPMMERKVAHCLRTGDVYDLEHRTIGEDGRTRWVQVHAKSVRSAEGRIERWFGTITDIDLRKRAEAALKASEDRFARAIAGARVGTWDWDMGTDEVVTSPDFAPQFHDLPEGSIRSSKDFLRAIHPDDAERMTTVLNSVVEHARRHGTAAYEAEYRIIRADGEVRWLSAQGNVTITPGDGRGGRLSGLTVDMSERRRAEELLQATQERLRTLNGELERKVTREVELRERAQGLLAQAQRMEALGQLAGGIAHDFNNVLQAVTAGLDMLQRRADQPEIVRQIAARTAAAAARGVAITGRLLSFARRSDLTAQEVEAVPLLENLRDLLAPTIGVGITLTVEGGSCVPPFLADRAQLETALVNLAVNARDAMREGGALVIGAQAAQVADGALPGHGVPVGLAPGEYVNLWIRDSGCGMSPDTLARASEPFFTTKPTGQGTGLGLSMARGFAEQSGGGLALASAVGQGTTVWLWFPALTSGPPGGADEPNDSSPQPTPPPRVLVVDDDHLVRSMLASQIEDMGYRVTEADSAAAALAQIAAGTPFDLLVTDYAMPGMNGLALAGIVRERCPTLPVLLITGYVDDDLRIDTASWNATTMMVMRKPLPATVLADAVESLLPARQRLAQTPRMPAC